MRTGHLWNVIVVVFFLAASGVLAVFLFRGMHQVEPAQAAPVPSSTARPPGPHLTSRDRPAEIRQTQSKSAQGSPPQFPRPPGASPVSGWRETGGPRAEARVVRQASGSAVPQREKPLATPAAPATPAPDRLAGTERDLRLAELKQQAAEETDPHEAQKTWLVIAGYQIGKGDWQEAREVYEQLKSSPYPDVVFATARNLDVVDRNLAIEAEPSVEQREWMQLDLAAVHEHYGHEKMAKRLLRSLQQSATQPTVREQAARQLSAYVVPPPVSFQPPITSSE